MILHLPGMNHLLLLIVVLPSLRMSTKKQQILKPAIQEILGGHSISINQAPYQVNYGDICGAVLVDRQWALTSAHCGLEEKFIRIGSRYRLRGRKVTILRHLAHPEFGNQHAFDFDIQLLKFRRLHFSTTVNAIQFGDGKLGAIYVSGWGYGFERGDYSDVLQQVELTTIPMEQCQAINNSWYNHTLTSRMFCAGGEGVDACQGDSGGAAVSFGRLVGLSSFGFGCGRQIPGVYTNVTESSIRSWIRRYTGT